MSDFAINVQDEGVVGDGVTDDAPALNVLFNSVALTGATTIYFPRGTYLIKQPVILDGSNQSSAISSLRVFADPGAIIKAATGAQGGSWGTSGACFKFRSSTTPATNVVIDGFTFEGQSYGNYPTNPDSITGIFTFAITGLTIRNCTFQNLGNTALGVASSPRNDGILLGDASSGSSARAKDVLIEKCRFVNIVRNGVSGLDVDGLTIENCYFDNMDNAGIDVEPNLATQFARDVKIDKCTFTNWSQQAVIVTPGGGPPSLLGSIYPAQMEGLKVSRCYMDGATTGKAGVQVRNWIDVDIAGNSMIRLIDPGVYLRSCQNVSVSNNKIRDLTNNTGAILVDMADTVQPQDHIIHGNRMKNISGYAIRVSDLDAGTISDNIIRVYDTNGAGPPAGRAGISVLTVSSTCKNITTKGNVVVGGGGSGGVASGGRPISFSSGCAHVLCVGNVCQEIGTSGSTASAIDNDAESTIHGFNSDDQRSTYPFTSPSGTTPLAGGAVGLSSTARKSSMEVTVSAGAAAGSVAVASDFITLVPVVNIVFSPTNSAAAAMVLIAGGVWCHRTSTGFSLTHQGNPAGTDAIFQIFAATS